VKLTIDKNDLERGLGLASPFLEKKNMDTVIANYQLRAENGTLEIIATDLKGGLKVKLDSGIMVERGGEILVNGVELLKVLKGTKRENLILEADEKTLTVRQGKTNLEVKIIEGELPKFPAIEGKSSIKFNGELLRDAFKKITPSIDATSPKYELTGGLLSIEKDGVKFVSTDTKRLIVVEEKIDVGEIDELELIIPKTAIVEIPKLFDGDIEFFYDEEALVITNKNLYFFTKLISGNYPNWKRIVPESFDKEYKFDRKTVVEHLKLVSAIKPELKVSLSGNSIFLETLKDGTSKTRAETEFGVDFQFDGVIEFGVNSKFVNDSLSIFDNDNFSFGFNEANRPFMVWSDNTRAVIMPINL
jgi:DNA polymerase-3 subunit beta